MILTKDNLLRFVRDKKAVTHAEVAQEFDTTTMIASAALSEVAKEKSILISYMKGSSSPYYYDPRQKEILSEIAQEKLSKDEKDIFIQLKKSQVLSDNSLSIQHRLAIEKIKDFAIPLEIEYQGREMKFWVWYLRDIKETKKQILDAIKPSKQETPKPAQQQKSVKKEPVSKAVEQTVDNSSRQRQSSSGSSNNSNDFVHPKFAGNQNSNNEKIEVEENPYEIFIENFLRQNYLKVESKNKEKRGILYEVSLNLGKMIVDFDCYYYFKKPKEPEIIKFYTSSMKPKIIFIEKCPKKLLNLSQKVENLTIINI